VSCARLDGGSASIDAGSIVPAQAWCEPDAGNSPDCPASLPEAGAGCPGASRCGYDVGATGFTLATCDQYWHEASHGCHADCGAPGADATVVGGVCGSLPDVACDENAYQTDEEGANRLFSQLADCCPHGGETSVTAWLQDGCATALSGDPALVQCLKGVLAGRRLSCATKSSCVTAAWSTLP
jgi:hypothetical protein